jgi:four helix bundle protein
MQPDLQKLTCRLSVELAARELGSRRAYARCGVKLIEAPVPLMPRIRQRDKSLEDQLRRAASSIGLNVAEAACSDPGNKRARFYTAAGSARETQHALRQAIAWRHVTQGDAELALALVKRIVAILWKMTQG